MPMKSDENAALTGEVEPKPAAAPGRFARVTGARAGGLRALRAGRAALHRRLVGRALVRRPRLAGARSRDAPPGTEAHAARPAARALLRLDCALLLPLRGAARERAEAD